MSHRRYNWLLLAPLAAALLVVAAVNAAVDPYGFLAAPTREDFNLHKPAFFANLRMCKPAAVRRAQPTSLILGSSTAEVGLDPRHPAWKGETVYNFGVSGATMIEVDRYLRHAHAARPLRRVVLLLDLFMFNVHYRRGREAALDEELAAGLGASFDRFAAALCSLKALEDSWDTIDYNRQNVGRQDAAQYLPEGQHPPSFLEHQLARGQRAAFVRCEQDYITRIFVPPPARQFSFSAPRADGTLEDTFDYFRAAVAYCRAENIELICVVSPCHARMGEAIAAAGLWPQYELWKRTLTEIVAAGDSADIRLWDFSGYNFAAVEDVPPEGDTQSRMQWYWESIHFRKELGDLLLERVLLGEAAGRDLREFGVQMTPNNLEAHLRSQRLARTVYAATHRDDEEVAALAPREGNESRR